MCRYPLYICFNWVHGCIESVEKWKEHIKCFVIAVMKLKLPASIELVNTICWVMKVQTSCILLSKQEINTTYRLSEP